MMAVDSSTLIAYLQGDRGRDVDDAFQRVGEERDAAREPPGPGFEQKHQGGNRDAADSQPCRRHSRPASSAAYARAAKAAVAAAARRWFQAVQGLA